MSVSLQLISLENGLGQSGTGKWCCKCMGIKNKILVPNLMKQDFFSLYAPKPHWVIFPSSKMCHEIRERRGKGRKERTHSHCQGCMKQTNKQNFV